MKRLTRVREYVRAHKAQATVAAVALVSVASHYIPGFPGGDALRVLLTIVGAA